MTCVVAIIFDSIIIVTRLSIGKHGIIVNGLGITLAPMKLVSSYCHRPLQGVTFTCLAGQEPLLKRRKLVPLKN